MSKLIVNADDFGLHPEVNAGIIAGHEQGIITSTSLLASGQAFEEAVALAEQHPHLGIGVHVCLVGGLAPVSPVDSVRSLLTEEGVFPSSYIELMKWMYTGKINYQELYTEIRAQFEKIKHTPLTITHVDGHQHMHVLSQVLPMVVSLMKEYNWQRMRIPEEAIFFTNGVTNPVRWAGKVGLSRVAHKARKFAQTMHVTTPDHFWGMINGGQLNEEALLGILERVASQEGVHEIMTHPGASNAILGDLYPWGYHWEQELAAMQSPRVKAFLEAHDISLINFGDLP